MPNPSLPSSEALTEAQPDNLEEVLYQRTKEWYNQDIETAPDDVMDLIIIELRANRARLLAADAAGAKAPRPRRSPKLDIQNLGTSDSPHDSDSVL